MESSSHLNPGRILQDGRYKLVRFISSGGFGCTYEAIYTKFDSRVVVKEFFIADFCNRDGRTGNVSLGTQSKAELVGKLKKKFIDEAKTVFNMHHQHIVRVIDVFEENGTAYYVMDFIDGQSLNDMVKTHGPLPEQKALKYIREIADALRYVHSFNRLHLDVKPGNIMVDKKDNSVLIDFGASKHYDEESGEGTSTFLGINTRGYAPVEQQNGSLSTFSPATDIYALGATLYKLLTGITPPDAVSLLSKERKLQPLPETVSETTRAAINAAMQLTRSDRPQSIDEFLAILDGTDGSEVEVVSVVDVEGTRIEGTDDGDIKVEAVQVGSGNVASSVGITAVNGVAVSGNNGVSGSNDISTDNTPNISGGSSNGPDNKEKDTPLGKGKEEKKKPLLQTVIIAVACAVVVGLIVYFAVSKSNSGSNGERELATTDTLENVERPELTQQIIPEKEESDEQGGKEDSQTGKPEQSSNSAAQEGGLTNSAASQQAQTAQQGAQQSQAGKPKTGMINGHEYVDLGLSVKWATCNVGASSPTGYGSYFAWGETSTKSEYTTDNSTTYGKDLGSIAGNSNYDVARAKWGGSWRLPTASEIDELKSKCKYEWTTQGSVNGYKVTGPNGNSIFLPAAGYRYGSSLSYQGSRGYYWSSTPDGTGNACSLYFYSGDFSRDWYGRFYGFSVRPVSE